MGKKTYYKNYKVIFLYSATITCIIIGLLLYYGRLIVVSDKVSSVLAVFIILAGYILLHIIAKRLKKKEIHGLTKMVWATFLLFILFSQWYNDSLHGVWWSINRAVVTGVLVFFLVDGTIRFVISLVSVIKAIWMTDNKTIESVDTAVAIATSVVAIIISIVEIC